MRPRLVVGNWKLNGTLAWAQALADAVVCGAAALLAREVQIAVAPPATALTAVRRILSGSGVGLAAQDIYPEDHGAYTGALSAPLVADAGATYAIVGHSERRALFHETDAGCAKRLAACARAQLTPILCVGETLAERDAGRTEAVVLAQLEAATRAYFTAGPRPLVVAYEPLWAIGTGKVASPGQAQAVHRALRATLGRAVGGDAAAAVRLLYGGSVKPDNAAALFAEPDIDGALVGGASLDGATFVAIASAGLSFSS